MCVCARERECVCGRANVCACARLVQQTDSQKNRQINLFDSFPRVFDSNSDKRAINVPACNISREPASHKPSCRHHNASCHSEESHRRFLGDFKNIASIEKGLGANLRLTCWSGCRFIFSFTLLARLTNPPITKLYMQN
jgi:hypothetical protein